MRSRESCQDGTQMELTPSEGAKWIKRLLDSETTGSQYQFLGRELGAPSSVLAHSSKARSP